MTFQEWMEQVDSEISQLTRLDSSDLADINYRDLFEDDISPNEAGMLALSNEGW